MISCYLALGSNLNDPKKQIIAAINHIKRLPESQFIAQASLYETKPLDGSEQNTFINSACLIKTSLTPDKLLHHCRLIENTLGKIKLYHWGPRTIDIDIVLYGNMQVVQENLTIPHPGLSSRDFVIEPLLELNSSLMLPDGAPLDSYRESMIQTIVNKIPLHEVCLA